jgi:hypothetical protein
MLAGNAHETEVEYCDSAVNCGKLRGWTAAPPMLLREQRFFSRHHGALGF